MARIRSRLLHACFYRCRTIGRYRQGNFSLRFLLLFFQLTIFFKQKEDKERAMASGEPLPKNTASGVSENRWKQKVDVTFFRYSGAASHFADFIALTTTDLSLPPKFYFTMNSYSSASVIQLFWLIVILKLIYNILYSFPAHHLSFFHKTWQKFKSLQK